jgi:Phosphoketolase
MRVVNEMDRFHLAEEAAVAVQGDAASDFADEMEAEVDKHNKYIREHGDDLPEVQEWTWE